MSNTFYRSSSIISRSSKLKSFIQQSSQVDLNEGDREVLIEFYRELQKQRSSIEHKNRLLKLALAEYFIQKKEQKPFYNLTTREQTEYTERYQKSIDELGKLHKRDNLLEEEINAKKAFVGEEFGKVKLKLDELREEFRAIVDNTKNLYETLGQGLSEKLLSKLLGRYEKVHREMSSVRLEFIKTQNALVDLQEKERALDDLGDGFKVMDYENLKTKLQTISSNIDAKNEELEKLRVRYRNNMRENKNLLKQKSQVEEKISDARRLFVSLKEEEESLRKIFQKSQSEREKLKIELDNVQIKSQLIDRVALLRQYDNIVDDIDRTNKELVEIESCNEKLNEKIKALEGDAEQRKKETREMELTKLDTFLSQKKDELESFFKSRNFASKPRMK